MELVRGAEDGSSPGGTTGWHSLPREVEAMVLSHLPPLHALRLASVCSSWHSVRVAFPPAESSALLSHSCVVLSLGWIGQAVRTAHVWRELKFTSGRVCARLLNEHLGRMSISFGTAVCAQSSSPHTHTHARTHAHTHAHDV
jgi:hypothetical protein